MTQRKRKIRVALVNLPQCVPELMYTPRVRKAYTETAQILPNLSLAYLAAGLEREGFEVLFIEAFALGLSVDEIGRKLREFQPVAVGYNLITETFLESLACIRAVRERCPIPNVVGGMHLSLYPGETLSHQCIDYGIIGEGWEAMPELLHALADGGAGLDAVRGLIFRRDGMVVRNPARDAVTQLETFPFPARRLLPINAYNCVMSKRHPITVMISSYGCPFHCAYCDVGNLGYQMRSAASVVAEMRECRSKYGIREIWFQDETFTLKEERILAICEAIRSEGLDITWSIRTRVELVSRAMLREMRSAGCFKIHFGVESADPTVLEHLNRNIPLEKIRCAFAWAKEEKISTLAFFMIGNPGEDRASIERTIRFAQGLSCDFIQVNKLTPCPPSRLYTRVVEETGRDFWAEYTAGNENAVAEMGNYYSVFPAEELDAWQKRFFRAYYFRPSHVARRLFGVRSLREFRSLARAALALR